MIEKGNRRYIIFPLFMCFTFCVPLHRLCFIILKNDFSYKWVKGTRLPLLYLTTSIRVFSVLCFSSNFYERVCALSSFSRSSVCCNIRVWSLMTACDTLFWSNNKKREKRMHRFSRFTHQSLDSSFWSQNILCPISWNMSRSFQSSMKTQSVRE